EGFLVPGFLFLVPCLVASDFTLIVPCREASRRVSCSVFRVPRFAAYGPMDLCFKQGPRTSHQSPPPRGVSHRKISRDGKLTIYDSTAFTLSPIVNRKS